MSGGKKVQAIYILLDREMIWVYFIFSRSCSLRDGYLLRSWREIPIKIWDVLAFVSDEKYFSLFYHLGIQLNSVVAFLWHGSSYD